MSASCWQGQQEISDAISIAGSQLFYSVLAAINFNEGRKKMACLVPLFCFSAFLAAHCHPWAVKPLAFPVLNFWKAGGRINCPGAPVLCAFHGPSLGKAHMQLCFTSHGRNGSWVCSPPFLWEAGGGLIPSCRAWRFAFPWRIGILRGPSTPGDMRHILILRSPEQGMVGPRGLFIQMEQYTHRCGREVSSTTLSSAGLFMLRFCLDQHAMEEMEVGM